MSEIINKQQDNQSRRIFLKSTLTGAVSLAVFPALALGQEQDTAALSGREKDRKFNDKGPPIDEALVFEFVQKCHFDLDIVKSMLPKEPNLLNSCWDWGSGDFETGLGGASHMGNREIALYLIEHGARTNIFAATMLGHLDIVQGFLNRYPDMINCKGPHGISLMRHAEKGGKESKDVLDYLKSLSE